MSNAGVFRMKRRLRFSGFVAGLGLEAVLIVAAGWWLWRQRETVERAKADLGAREAEWRALVQSQPAPTETVAAAIEAEVARGEREGKRLWRMSGLQEPSSPLLEGRMEEAFFEIAGLVERMRGRAAECGVKLSEGERFGFAEYAKIGPDASRVAEVRRQRRLAEAVLEALFAAGPRELMGCGRGRSVEEESRWAMRSGEEEFEIDRRLTLAVPGVLGATAYRVRFIGRTETLRALLNRLARSELAMAVREVEVEVAEDDGMREPDAPWVRSTWSRFAVTVEYVEAVEAPEAPAS